MAVYVVGILIAALCLGLAFRKPKLRAVGAAPTRWELAKARFWRTHRFLWICLQVIGYILTTTAIAGILVMMVVGSENLVDPEKHWFLVRVTKPWSGWWLPQLIAAFKTLALLAAKFHVFEWARGDKADKTVIARLKHATEIIFYLCVTGTGYAILSDVVAFLLALWREVSAMF